MTQTAKSSLFAMSDTFSIGPPVSRYINVRHFRSHIKAAQCDQVSAPSLPQSMESSLLDDTSYCAVDLWLETLLEFAAGEKDDKLSQKYDTLSK